MVVTVGDIAWLPVLATFPIPLSINTEVAPTTFHCKVENCPEKIVEGATEKLTIVGGETKTGPTVKVVVMIACTVPFEAVNVYVVVLAGEICRLPVDATAPIPGSILTEVAPFTDHCMTADCPAVIAGGFILNRVMTGAVGVGVGVGVGCGTTVRIAIDVMLPILFVAVIIYVVVLVAVTVWLPARATLPIPGSILAEFAPITFQLRVAEPPGEIVDGVTLKFDMTGTAS